jgi:flagellar export protein FliJ
MKARCALDAVLTVRERQEHVAQESYAASVRLLRQSQDVLTGIESQVAAMWAAGRTFRTQGSCAEEFHRSNLYSQRLEELRRSAAAQVVRAQVNAETARQEMLFARRRRELVEKYLENQGRKRALARSRAEHKMLDEIGQQRWRAPQHAGANEERCL